MAIGIYFSPAAMSAAKYDECIKLLKKAGAGNPAGRSYHAAFGPKDKLMVFDVWTSQAAFDKFGKTLMPILQQLGIDPGQPAVMPVHMMPVHKVIVPTAKVDDCLLDRPSACGISGLRYGISRFEKHSQRWVDRLVLEGRGLRVVAVTVHD